MSGCPSPQRGQSRPPLQVRRQIGQIFSIAGAMFARARPAVNVDCKAGGPGTRLAAPWTARPSTSSTTFQPYSYLASTQLRGISERTGATPRCYPITLGGVRKATGHQIPPPQQLSYMAEDTARWSQKVRRPMQIPKAFPISTSSRSAPCRARGTRRRARHAGAVPGVLGRGEDISDPALVESVLRDAGLDGKRLVAMTSQQDVKDELRKNTIWRSREGLRRAHFFVGERSFWGNDRLEFVESALRQARLST